MPPYSKIGRSKIICNDPKKDEFRRPRNLDFFDLGMNMTL